MHYQELTDTLVSGLWTMEAIHRTILGEFVLWIFLYKRRLKDEQQ